MKRQEQLNQSRTQETELPGAPERHLRIERKEGEMTNKTPLRRLFAGVGAVVLGLTGAMAMSSVAAADVGPDQPTAPARGTLTINKYKGGQTQNPSEDDRLDGVQFTVTQVGRTVDEVCTPIDLTDPDDWDGLDGATGLFASAPAAPTSPFCLMEGAGYVFVDETVNGQISLNLDVGIYFVQETDPGEHSIVSPVPNFYVSIPTSVSGTTGGWNYNVVVDPKNQLAEAPTKVVEDQVDLVVGGEVTWTITVPVPTLNNNETFNQAVVTDVLDSRLSYASSTVVVGNETFTAGTDYTVDEDAVSWTFTEAGLVKLNGLMGSTMTITLVTTVDEVGNGEIPNDDYTSNFNGTEVPGGPTPYTYWGLLKILKVDEAELPLAGAEFKVWPKTGEACAAEAPESGEIATGTSNAAGVVIWVGLEDPADELGLWVANVNDGPAAPLRTKDYCVYETVVPAGYVGGAIANPVTITSGESVLKELTVVNSQRPGPELPLTGGSGTVGLMAAGVIVAGAGVGVMLNARRRRNMAA